MAELLIVFIGAGLVLGAGAWIEQHERPIRAWTARAASRVSGLPRRWIVAVRTGVVSYRERRIDRAWRGNSERGIR